jgi:hypothetical protein
MASLMDPLEDLDLTAVIPFTVWPVEGAEADARSYVAATARHAAEKCAEDDYADENEWSIAYKVRDGATGHLWEIRVGVVAQPSFVTLEARTIQMQAASHVLWGGKVLCADLRLRGVPRDWPADQRWISLADVADGAKAPPDRCEACWDKAPGLVDGIRRIGKK